MNILDIIANKRDKKELLTEINNLLVMGSFEAIYFSEYLFLN